MRPIWAAFAAACSHPTSPPLSASAPSYHLPKDYALYDACADGERAACAALWKAFNITFAYPACRLGEDGACEGLVSAPATLVDLAVGCAAGSASACERFGRERLALPLAEVEDALAAGCGQGVVAACEPERLLKVVDGPVTAVARVAHGVGWPLALWVFEDGVWVLGSDAIEVLSPSGDRRATWTFAPVTLVGTPRTEAVRVRDDGRGRLWHSGGEPSAETCSETPGPWTPTDGCRVWSLGGASVTLPDGVADTVGGDAALWASDADRVYVARADGAPPRPSPYQRIVYADDDLVLLTGDGGTAAYARGSGAIRWGVADRATTAARSPDGRWLATASPGLALRDPSTGAPAYEVAVPCTAVAWTGDGDLLCAARDLLRFTVHAGTAAERPMPQGLPANWPAPRPVTVDGVVTGAHGPVRIGWGGHGLDALPDQPFQLTAAAADGALALTVQPPGEPVRVQVDGDPVKVTIALVDAVLHFEGCTRPVDVSWRAARPDATAHAGITDGACDLPVAGLIGGAAYDVRGTYPGLTAPPWYVRIVARSGPIPLPLTAPPPAGPPPRVVNVAVTGAPGPSAVLIGAPAGADQPSRSWRLDAPAIPIEPGRWRLIVFDGALASPWFEAEVGAEGIPLELPAPSESHVAVGRLVPSNDLHPCRTRAYVVLAGTTEVVASFVTDLGGRYTAALPFAGPGLELRFRCGSDERASAIVAGR